MAKKLSNLERVRRYLAKYPNATNAQIVADTGTKVQVIYNLRYLMKKKQKVAPVPDVVNQPPHYTDGGVDTIDFIEAKGLGYHLGNVVKYISRAGKKGTNKGLEDLRKARWYLDRAIERNEYANPSV
jgi:hypothetical protein